MNDNKKVVIDLDEYLKMKENLDRLSGLIELINYPYVRVESEHHYDPLRDGMIDQIIVVDDAHLKIFLNELMNTKDLNYISRVGGWKM